MAARPDGNGGWEISLVRHGRLAAAGVAGRGAPPWPVVDMLRATAETVLPGIGPTPSASGEETERILAWLLLSDVKVVAIDGTWAMPPRHAAERWRGLLDRVDSASDSADPFADRRGLRPLHRPARASA